MAHPPHSGTTAWRCPSNLAIVKYWGKHSRQLPRNASISLTLSQAHTDTTCSYSIEPDLAGPQLDFRFEGKPMPAFSDKILRYLHSIADELPFIPHLRLEVQSQNSFPHSSGIASSASSMAAMALCLCDIAVASGYMDEADFLRRASHFARLGSGSASRSVYPHLAAWGQHSAIADSSDLYAVPYSEAAPVFHTMHDDICIVSTAEKSVSSTAGHQLMENNPYASARYQQANDRLSELLHALRTGDVPHFGQIAEDEALTLHGMMMCSRPSYMLMEANTIEMIRRIQLYRQESGVAVYFSLDAGPNIHLLYPDEVADAVSIFVQEQIRPLCVQGRIIQDQVGNGPSRLVTV